MTSSIIATLDTVLSIDGSRPDDPAALPFRTSTAGDSSASDWFRALDIIAAVPLSPTAKLSLLAPPDDASRMDCISDVNDGVDSSTGADAAHDAPPTAFAADTSTRTRRPLACRVHNGSWTPSSADADCQTDSANGARDAGIAASKASVRGSALHASASMHANKYVSGDEGSVPPHPVALIEKLQHRTKTAAGHRTQTSTHTHKSHEQCSTDLVTVATPLGGDTVTTPTAGTGGVATSTVDDASVSRPSRLVTETRIRYADPGASEYADSDTDSRKASGCNADAGRIAGVATPDDDSDRTRHSTSTADDTPEPADTVTLAMSRSTAEYWTIVFGCGCSTVTVAESVPPAGDGDTVGDTDDDALLDRVKEAEPEADDDSDALNEGDRDGDRLAVDDIEGEPSGLPLND
jgi:hypothetical protein